MVRCGEEICGRAKRRNKLEGTSNLSGWMEGWMNDGMVLEAANIPPPPGTLYKVNRDIRRTYRHPCI